MLMVVKADERDKTATWYSFKDSLIVKDYGSKEMVGAPGGDTRGDNVEQEQRQAHRFILTIPRLDRHPDS